MQAGSYTEEIIGVSGTSFTVTGLTTGVTYKLKVQARNAFGLGDFSAEVFILAAQIPDVPSAPSTSIDQWNVLIDWTAPDSQGS